jgi:hypothetical protein
MFDASEPGAVTSYSGTPAQQSDLGELDPRDDDGFARILGQWTRQVPFWPGSQLGQSQARRHRGATICGNCYSVEPERMRSALAA